MKIIVLMMSVVLVCIMPGCEHIGIYDKEIKMLQEHRGCTVHVPSPSETFFKKDGTLSVLRSNSSMVFFDYERADTPAKRARGLMYRAHMQETESMLFLFDAMAPRFFYMKNTYIPLDILFLDQEKCIVKIHHHVKPLSVELLPSEKKARYALEVCAGSCQKNNICEGDIVLW